jgi:predicted nucleotidyltransferase
MDTENNEIKEAVDYLNRIFDIVEIYLFGSFIGENFSDESDIDMALFLKDYDKYTLKDFAKILYYIQNHISSRIEIHFFPEKIDPLTFPDHIKNIGKKVA